MGATQSNQYHHTQTILWSLVGSRQSAATLETGLSR